MLCRKLSQAWQTFTVWLHPAAGWITADGTAATQADLQAVLESGGVGSEPVMRVRGDAVMMSASLLSILESGSDRTVSEDYTELRWIRCGYCCGAGTVATGAPRVCALMWFRRCGAHTPTRPMPKPVVPACKNHEGPTCGRG